MQRLTLIRAGLILNAFIICLVYTYKIKGPWWALAASVGAIIFNSVLWFCIENKNIHEVCVFGTKKEGHGWLVGNGCCDIWNFIHFFFWVLIGLLVPDKYVVALLASIFFELFEEYFSNWGRVEDVFINMAGYTIGSLLSKAR